MRGMKKYTGRGKSGSMSQIPKSKVNGKVRLLSSVLEADSMERMILQITEKLFCAGVWICSVLMKRWEVCVISEF